MRIAPTVGAGKPTSRPVIAAPVKATELPADRFIARTTAAIGTEGVGRHWLSRLPSVLRVAAVPVFAWLGRTAHTAKNVVLRREDSVAADPKTPLARAEATWNQLEKLYGVPGMPGVFTETTSAGHPATVWPHGQAIGAALDIAQLTGDYSQVDATMRTLSGYMTDGAYAPSFFANGTSKRLWDDNAWVGLDFMQAYAQTGNQEYLAAAEKLFPFMEEGLHKDGGVYWEERNERMTRNTCANAPAIQMALRLHQATRDPKYLAYAQNLDAFMTKSLRSPEGLYYDHVSDSGETDQTIYSYNQGAAIGADVLMYRTTGDTKYLARAKETANASLAYFGQDDRLWKGSPAFNAILLRNMLALDVLAPDPRYRALTQNYVDRVWKEGRDPATGKLDKGGIGSYSPPGLLDQSGFAQLNALLAWPKDRLLDVG